MDSETAGRITARALARELARESARRPIDYDRMSREYPRQKSALTRALNAGDADRVLIVCADAVRVWDEIGAWPDDWSRFQRALDDVSPAICGPRLEDLRD